MGTSNRVAVPNFKEAQRKDKCSKQNDFVQWLGGSREWWRAWSELQLISCRESKTRKALGIKVLHSRKNSVLQLLYLSFPGNTKTSTSYMKSHFLE